MEVKRAGKNPAEVGRNTQTSVSRAAGVPTAGKDQRGLGGLHRAAQGGKIMMFKGGGRRKVEGRKESLNFFMVVKWVHTHTRTHDWNHDQPVFYAFRS